MATNVNWIISLCLELEGKDVEDLFTAVLSPSNSQSSQLAQPPSTIPNVPVMTVPQQGPGIFHLYALCPLIVVHTLVK